MIHRSEMVNLQIHYWFLVVLHIAIVLLLCRSTNAGETSFLLENLKIDSLHVFPENLPIFRTIVLTNVTISGSSERVFSRFTKASISSLVINGGSMEAYLYPDLEKLVVSTTNMNGIHIDDADSYKLKSVELKGIELTKLPDNFHSLKQLQSIDLSDNKLQHIDMSTFASMLQLKRLILTHNWISEISAREQIVLPELQLLSLNWNGLIELDLSNWNLPSIEEVDIQRNSLSDVPRNIAQLESLSSINLSSNRLKSINMSVFNGLDQLQELQLQGNQLNTIESSSRVHLPQLVHLCLINNDLITINFAQFDLPRLRLLHLESNNLQSIYHLKHLKNVTDILLGANSLEHLDFSIFNGLNNLKILRIDSNQLNDIITSETVHIPEITEINLNQNNLDELDVTKWNCPQLHSLKLSFNILKRLPKNMNQLNSLETIDLYNNHLETISGEEFLGMKALKKLNLDDNQIVITNTNTMFHFPNLRWLILTKNNLSGTFDFTRWELPSLEYLWVAENHLQSMEGFPQVMPKLKHVGLWDNQWNCDWLGWAADKMKQAGIESLADDFAECDRKLAKICCYY